MFRVVLLAVATSLCASQLSAQITTYVAPPRQLPASPQAVATADSVRRDSVNQVAMRNMKEWVDSAAGVAVPAHDTAMAIPANDPGRPVTTTFSNGSVAPETASDLPALAVIGFVGLVVGAGLLANKPRV